MIEYRNKITAAILGDEEICELMDTTKAKAVKDLYYRHIYPHEYIPETMKDADKYINFELQASMDWRNNVFNDITIWFFVLCHDDLLRTDKGLWTDRTTCRIDEIFTENNILGIGTTSLMMNAPYVPTKDVRGRALTFKVKDFTKGGKYGK